MLVTFTRKRLIAVLDALSHGTCITAPANGHEWDDSEILAVAGACMSELMFRREVEQDETADEPLRFHSGRNYGQLSGRLSAALNYALGVASNLSCGTLAGKHEAPDKTYKVEIRYDMGEFRVRLPKDEAGVDSGGGMTISHEPERKEGSSHELN